MKKNKNNHEGYIPLFRRFLDSELWLEKRKFSRAEAWIDLLFMARYGEEPIEIIDRGEHIQINKGEILTSIKTLAKRWSRSETWVRALLEHLESKGSIKKHTKKNRRTIISIVNSTYYQELSKKRSTETLTEEAQKKHRKSHKNKDNKVNKDNIYISGSGKEKGQSEVDQIYSSYKNLINPNSRLTEGARMKIRTRLKTFTAADLLKAMTNFSKDSWWMEHNSSRGVAWFFANDERIDQLINLKPRGLVSKKWR